jgi:hypothetical protein
MRTNNGGGRKGAMARRLALGTALAWGPGIVVGVIFYFATRRVPYSLLAFAVATALTAIVLGAASSVMVKRHNTGR